MTKLFIFYVILVLTSVPAWLTHVIFCLKNHEYLLLIAGAIVAPIGVIHGIAIWLGMPWV